MIYQKRGMWKVAGSSVKYKTESEAQDADPDSVKYKTESEAQHADPDLCNDCGLEECDCCTLCNKYICECIEDGDFEEGHSNGGSDEVGIIPESTYRSVPKSSWHRTHSQSDSSD